MSSSCIGLTSEEFVLRLPADLSKVSGPDDVVLAALADAAGTSGELRGPPLWRASSRRFRTAYRRAVVAQARDAGLVERTLKPSLFLIYAMIFASCTWPLWLDQRLVLLVPVLSIAAMIASVPFLSRVGITDEGVKRRARWLAYRRWLRAQDQLRRGGCAGNRHLGTAAHVRRRAGRGGGGGDGVVARRGRRPRGRPVRRRAVVTKRRLRTLTLPVLLWRGFWRRCPQCGSAGIFDTWFKLRPRCPRCHFPLQREEGYWIGGIGMNTVVTFGLVGISLLVSFIVTWEDRRGAAVFIPAFAVAADRAARVLRLVPQPVERHPPRHDARAS